MAKEKITGVYKITNTITNKCYIGSSTNIYARWGNHISNMKLVSNTPLFNDCQLFGVESFKFEILEICEESQLHIVENKYVDLYNACDSNYGYNVCRYIKPYRNVS